MPRCLLGVSAAVLAGVSVVAASGELAKGYLVSLNDAFDTFTAAEVAAITCVTRAPTRSFMRA